MSRKEVRTPEVMTTDWNLWKTGLMAIDGSMQLRGEQTNTLTCDTDINLASLFTCVKTLCVKE